jgi:hypothetical protein
MTNRIKQFAHSFFGAVTSHKAFAIAAFFAVILTTWIGVQAMRNDNEQDAQDKGANRTIAVEERSWPKGVLELVEVVNAQSQDFPKGLELKVKNISDKPIYFCLIAVSMPEAKNFIGVPAGIMVRYGDRRLASFTAELTAEDAPIMPKEVMSLTEPLDQLWHWFEKLEPEAKKQMMEIGFKHIEIVPQLVNFGDGTGFATSKPYPRRLISLLPRDGNGNILPVPMDSPCPGGGGSCVNGTLNTTATYCFESCQNYEITVNSSSPCVTRTQIFDGCCYQNSTSTGCA